jgi:hypothetical protein
MVLQQDGEVGLALIIGWGSPNVNRHAEQVADRHRK